MLALAVAFGARRIDRIHAHAGVDELLDDVWSDAPAALRPAASATLAAHLDKLDEDQVADQQGRAVRQQGLRQGRPDAAADGVRDAHAELLVHLDAMAGTPAAGSARTTFSFAPKGANRVRARMPGVGDDAEVLHVVTPADWGRQGMAAGTPFVEGSVLS